MLRAEFPFHVERQPQRLLAWLLDEALLGFLAILATALTLFPMLFAVGPAVSSAIDSAQWCIIGWFAVEYGFALAVSRDRLAFLRSPWRLLDLATILIPLASLLPSVSRALLSSPVLRLVRLIRIVTFGVRASGIVVRDQRRALAATATAGPAQVLRVAGPAAAAPTPASWDEALQWLRAPAPGGWFHIASANADELRQIGEAAGLPAGFLETNLVGTSYPHFAGGRDCAALFAWMPELDASGRTDRHAVLFVAWADRVLSLSRRATPLVERRDTLAAADETDARRPFAVRTLAGELDRVLLRNESLVAGFEQELRALEDVPVRESQPAFFERTFRLKKELSAAQSDLWRLKNVLADLGERRTRLPGAGEADAEPFGRLAARAAYLYETVLNIREEALSVIELHLNVVSFDMNRVMRVLAVVSVLGLIPAVIGGLFGMNLADNPWPFTLPQVAFAIGFGMLVGLYLFFVKGWLR